MTIEKLTMNKGECDSVRNPWYQSLFAPLKSGTIQSVYISSTKCSLAFTTLKQIAFKMNIIIFMSILFWLSQKLTWLLFLIIQFPVLPIPADQL